MFQHSQNLGWLSLLDMKQLLLPLQQEEKKKAVLMWELVLGSLQTLSVKDSEARVLWSILAAIFHLGLAGAARGESL